MTMRKSNSGWNRNDWISVLIPVMILVFLIGFLAAMQLNTKRGCLATGRTHYEGNQSDYVIYDVGNGNDRHKWIITSERNSENLGCCYPDECPQSNKNPKPCYCMYAVRCGR